MDVSLIIRKTFRVYVPLGNGMRFSNSTQPSFGGFTPGKIIIIHPVAIVVGVPNSWLECFIILFLGLLSPSHRRRRRRRCRVLLRSQFGVIIWGFRTPPDVVSSLSVVVVDSKRKRWRKLKICLWTMKRRPFLQRDIIIGQFSTGFN